MIFYRIKHYLKMKNVLTCLTYSNSVNRNRTSGSIVILKAFGISLTADNKSLLQMIFKITYCSSISVFFSIVRFRYTIVVQLTKNLGIHSNELVTSWSSETDVCACTDCEAALLLVELQEATHLVGN